ncbi:MAG: glycine betaine ABC transporter substrate-binding protein [Thermodesulfobacteriota bacterium]|nr:glycine betaine ABC transporter substrate-binding protein [Thermodesulfobacteriota bacterium]
MRRLWIIIGSATFIVLTVIIIVFIDADREEGDKTEKRIAIGSKHFTEQEITGELMAQIIENNTDIKVKRRFNLGGTMICFNALKSGDIDLYAEYTGTSLVNILKKKTMNDPERVYSIIKDTFNKEYGLDLLKPFGFNNTYTLTMRRDHASELRVNKISDLLPYVKMLQAGFDAEFLERTDGYQGLVRRYGFKFQKRPKQMDPGLMYKACAEGEVDVIDGFATDGRIRAYNLLVLKDDKSFFPPYYAAPLIRSEVVKKYPEIEEVLNSLAWIISDKIMQRLNYKVDKKEDSAFEVARSFLLDKGLIGE